MKFKWEGEWLTEVWVLLPVMCNFGKMEVGFGSVSTEISSKSVVLGAGGYFRVVGPRGPFLRTWFRSVQWLRRTNRRSGGRMRGV